MRSITVYLDMCAIQRPLDSFEQVKVRLEAEAVLGILQYSASRRVRLVSSEVLQYECEQNPWPIRREHGQAVMAKARTVVILNETIEARAHNLAAWGIKAVDALHVAAAEAAHCMYFCTCDRRLSRQLAQVADLALQVIGPVELVQRLEDD